MSKQNTPTGLFSPSRFTFGKLLTPKTRQVIEFDIQPTQDGTQNSKKTGLEAYAKKNKLSLDADFSDKVLECEMELEKDDVSIECITKLTDLYTQAMAYYEAEGNHKHKYFAKKLQDLMLKPSVKETMVREIAPVKSAEDDKELRRMRLESQVSKVNTEKEAFTLVKTHEHKEKEIKKVLEKDLNSQRDRIQKKLAERKAKSQSRAQSVTYISDENSSTTEEAQNELEKDIDSSPKAHKLIKIEEADEADENRYGTPPRRRTKDGQMIFYFPKGKKNLKKLFLEELKEKSEQVKKIGRHARRYSENKPSVLAPVSSTPVAAGNKRAGRAQSFCTRTTNQTLVDKARKFSSNSLEKDGEESKTDSHEKDARSLSGIGKDEALEIHSAVEKKEEEKVKSNNTVEETDEEGSKNDGNSSKNSVAHEGEESPKGNSQGEEVAQVVSGAEKEVVVEPIVINNEPSEVPEEKEEVVETEKELVVEQQEEKQVEQVVEAVEEAEPVVEVPEVVKEEVVAVREEVEEVAVEENKVNEIVVEQQEEKEPEVQVVEESCEIQAAGEVQDEAVREEKVEEVTQVGDIEKVQIVEDIQEEQAAKEENAEEVEEEKPVEDIQVADNIQEEQASKEDRVEEAEEEKPVEEVQVADNVQEEPVKEEELVDDEPQQTEVVNVEVVETEEPAPAQSQKESQIDHIEVQEEKAVEVQEEVKVDNENIPVEIQEQVEVKVEEKAEENQVEEKVAAAARRRTDSEIADEEKLKMMRQLDEENKVLLEDFVKKQEQAREEAGKQVEEKFTKKIQAMEEDMEPDEKLSMMWQKAVAKINKDKETELQKVLEGLVQEHSQEAEKYKKKLQQQKMFKLAQISS